MGLGSHCNTHQPLTWLQQMKDANSQLTQMVPHITTLPVQYHISRYGQQNVIDDLLLWHRKSPEKNGIRLMKNTGLIFFLN